MQIDWAFADKELFNEEKLLQQISNMLISYLSETYMDLSQPTTLNTLCWDSI